MRFSLFLLTALLPLTVCSQVMPEYPVPYRLDSLWGYADTNMQMVVTPQYQQVNVFSGPVTTVWKNGKIALINTSGKLLTDFMFDQAGEYSEGMIKVIVDGKAGFVNEKGKLAVKNIYDGVESFHDGLAIVSKKGKIGVINKKGKTVIPFHYDWASPAFSDGKLLVQKDSIFFFIDKKNKPLRIPSDWQIAGDFSEGLAPVYRDEISFEHGEADTMNRLCFINTTGEVVIDSLFSLFDIYDGFHNGKAMVFHEDPLIQMNSYYYLNRQGKVSEFFIYARPFGNGLAAIRRMAKDSAEVVDTAYQTVFVLDAENAGVYCDERLQVAKGQQFGYLDTRGEIAIPLKYENASPFKRGIAIVLYQGQPGCIDTRGREYWKDTGITD